MNAVDVRLEGVGTISAPLQIVLLLTLLSFCPRFSSRFDTAGRSPRDAGNADILDVLAGRDVCRRLLLPADTTATQARRIIDRFSRTQPDRLVLTRLDEATAVGPLMAVLKDYKLPVSYLAHGQNVPDDLRRATPAALADWVPGETIGGATA